MKQLKAKKGTIFDAETGEPIAIVSSFVSVGSKNDTSFKLRSRLAKLAVDQYNAEERGMAFKAETE